MISVSYSDVTMYAAEIDFFFWIRIETKLDVVEGIVSFFKFTICYLLYLAWNSIFGFT